MKEIAPDTVITVDDIRSGKYKVDRSVRPHILKMLTGPLTSKEFVAYSACGSASPMWDGKRGEDGYRIPELNQWLPTYVTGGRNPAFENLYIALDRHGKPIKVGDTVYYASKNEAYRGEVKKIGEPKHLGYGHYARPLTVKSEDADKAHRVSDPTHCIKAD